MHCLKWPHETLTDLARLQLPIIACMFGMLAAQCATLYADLQNYVCPHKSTGVTDPSLANYEQCESLLRGKST